MIDVHKPAHQLPQAGNHVNGPLSLMTGIYEVDYNPLSYTKRSHRHVAGLINFATAMNSAPRSRIHAPSSGICEIKTA